MQIISSPSSGQVIIQYDFTDEFTGTGKLDKTWTPLFGTWQKNGSGKAVSSNGPSTYSQGNFPLVSFLTQKSENLVLKAEQNDYSQGYGVAFWVTDSNNWWAAVIDAVAKGGDPFLVDYVFKIIKKSTEEGIVVVASNTFPDQQKDTTRAARVVLELYSDRSFWGRAELEGFTGLYGLATVTMLQTSQVTNNQVTLGWVTQNANFGTTPITSVAYGNKKWVAVGWYGSIRSTQNFTPISQARK